MGVTVTRSANVAIKDMTVRDCWGDGFYVCETNKGITLAGLRADHNRRQGLSVVGADGIVVKGCTFANTEGTAPECGIDVEPNPGETVTHLLITGCTVTGNRGGGIGMGPSVKNRDRAFFTHSRILRNTIRNNGGFGLEISACSDNALEENTIAGTRGYGILLRDGARNITVRANKVEGSARDGIYLGESPGSVVTGNTVAGSGGLGIFSERNCGAAVTGNTLRGNARD
jgi:parallel beta-helix repeat protein